MSDFSKYKEDVNRVIDDLCDVIMEYADLSAKLRAENERLEKLKIEIECHNRWHQKPPHGPCCTCQNCGLFYDDCRCDLDEMYVENKRLRKDKERLDFCLEHMRIVSPFPRDDAAGYIPRVLSDRKSIDVALKEQRDE